MVSRQLFREWCVDRSICAILSSCVVPTERPVLRSNIRDLAHDRARFGYLQIWELLQREGRRLNLKEARRLYSLHCLQLWMLVRCPTHTALHRKPAPGPVGLQERWSTDFVHNTLADTRPYRILTVVDQWSCFSPVRDRGGPTLPPVQSVIPRRPTQPQEPTGPSQSNRKVPEHPARGRACAWASGLFCEHLLQDDFVQGQIRHELLESAVLFLQLS